MPSSRESGFSLIEIMIGVTVLGLMMMGTMQLSSSVSKQTRSIASTAEEGKMFRGAGQQMISLIEGADISSMFLNLPVSTEACATDQPCIREMSSENKLTDSTLSGVTRVQFFRDMQGAMLEKPAWEAKPAVVKYNAIIPASAYLGADKKYVTWPLVKDDTARPFVMLSRHKVGDYFTFIDAFAGDPVPSAADRWVLFESSRANLDIEKFRNLAFVLYNSFAPEQFFFQMATDVMDCKVADGSGESICFNIASAMNASVVTDVPPTVNLKDGKHYAIKLEKIPSAKLEPFVTALPGSTGSFFSQTGMQLIPHEVMSMQEAGNAHFSGDIDVRRVVHYYHVSSANSRIIAYPVEMSAFKLKSRVVGGKKTVEMLSRSFGATDDKPTMMGLPDSTRIYFARKVGTLEVSVLVYQ